MEEEEILEIMEAKQVILIRSRSRNTASPLEKKLRLNDLIYKTIEIQSSGQYMCFLSLSLSLALFIIISSGCWSSDSLQPSENTLHTDKT